MLLYGYFSLYVYIYIHIHYTYIHIFINITPLYIGFFFFYQGFLSRTLTTHRAAEEGRGPSYSTLPLPPLTNIQTSICNFARKMTITYF